MFLKALLVSTLVLYSLRSCNSANILIVSITPWYSHHITFMNTWRELGYRGHNITFLSAFPEDENLRNFTVIDASATHSILNSYSVKQITTTSMWFLWTLFHEMGTQWDDATLSLPKVRELIENHEKYTFDAVLSEPLYVSLFAFAKLYKCPLILYSSIEVHDNLISDLGNEINHVTLPEMNNGLYRATNFLERLQSWMFMAHERINEYLIYMPQRTTLLRKHFPNLQGLTVQELKQDIDLMVVSTNPVLQGVRALSPTTVEVGGGIHIQPRKILPQDLKVFLDEAKEGFIYISLGTIVQSKDLEDILQDDIFEVVKDLPYQILWKFEDDSFIKKSQNIKFIRWGPQQDILRHPNIKLFVSQGGIQSLEEAIFAHVPVLVMPFFGDQLKNAQMIASKRIGKTVSHNPRLEKSEFQNVIHELIHNPEYKNNVERLASLMKDTDMPGLEKAVWWIEYVIRNNGTKELRNPAVKLPYYQYYALDVISFILVLIVTLAFIIKMILKSVWNTIKRILTKRKQKLS